MTVMNTAESRAAMRFQAQTIMETLCTHDVDV